MLKFYGSVMINEQVIKFFVGKSQQNKWDIKKGNHRIFL